MALRYAVEGDAEVAWVEIECDTLDLALRAAGQYRLDGILGSLKVWRVAEEWGWLHVGRR